MRLSGVFQITSWDESAYRESENGAKQSHAKITQNYSGDIEGNSELQYLMSYQTKSTARFVGFETVTAILNGKQGTFVIQHNGIFANGVASSDFSIVENSGTNDLEGISGTGKFQSTDNGSANYQLDLA